MFEQPASKIHFFDFFSVEDINQRLKETSEINIKLEAETLEVTVELPALKTEAPSTLPEPCNNVAAADPAVPATFCEPAISESESKPEEKADECPDFVLDSESKTTPTVQECHPCEKISTVAGKSVNCMFIKVQVGSVAMISRKRRCKPKKRVKVRNYSLNVKSKFNEHIKRNTE